MNNIILDFFILYSLDKIKIYPKHSHDIDYYNYRANEISYYYERDWLKILKEYLYE